VKLEAVGRPILTASCYCASCQEAGSRFEQLPSAPPVLNPDGGTDYVLYRKDMLAHGRRHAGAAPALRASAPGLPAVALRAFW
jgi:hypothetical protein